MEENPLAKVDYYIGDLCYVMDDDEWSSYCNMVPLRAEMLEMLQDEEGYDSEFWLDDSGERKFFAFSTTYGDGTYTDREGRNYSVDSGQIGAIRISDITATDRLKNAVEKGLGHVISMPWDLDATECGWEDGVIIFYNIAIDTAA